MRPIPELDDPEKRARWKNAFRKLLRTQGCQQKEVAIEMARIVSLQSGRLVQNNAFVSSLSRFINGKDSAFPSWFMKEESRLLPLAQAMGLKSTDIFWSLLNQAAGKEESIHVAWHSAFPESSVIIPAQCNGKSIESLVDSLVLRLRRRSVHNPSIWIVGRELSGRSYAARQLQAALADRNLNLPIGLVTDFDPNVSAILISKDLPQESSPADAKLIMDPWGPQELLAVVEQLENVLRPSQRNIAQDFIALIKKDISYLGSDRRPSAIIDLLAAVIAYGLPKEPIDTRLILLRSYWRKALREEQLLESLKMEHLAVFWAFCFEEKWGEGWGKISKKELLQYIQHSFGEHYSLLIDRAEVFDLISLARTSSKKNRQQALDKLESWVSLSSAEHIAELLLSAKMIKQVGSYYSPCSESIALNFAVYGLVMLKRAGIAGQWQRLSASWWPKVLTELAIMGLQAETLIGEVEAAPEWARLDVAQTILRFAASTLEVLPLSILSPAWFDSLYAEIHRVFWNPTSLTKDDFHQAIQTVSMRYIRQFPCFSNWNEELRKEVTPAVLRLVNSWAMGPIRDPQSLSPAQFPPRSITDWKKWKILPPLSIPAWEVLYQRSRIGDEAAIRLLSEGEGRDDVHWSSSPISYRLEWLGYLETTNATILAFQLLCSEIWHRKKSVDESLLDAVLHAAKRLGEKQLYTILERWTHPLSITQQICFFRMLF